MKVSHRGLYALKALGYLAESYERGLVKIHEIAEGESIPVKFLEGILVTLKNARLVSSQRGREGGYRLRRPPAEIKLGDVMRLVDGPLAPFGRPLRHLPRRAQRRRRHPRPHQPGRPAGAQPPPAERTGAAGARRGGSPVKRRRFHV
jgi:Rrf2 family protein